MTFTVLFSSSCQEEPDTTPPVVTITEPADGLDLFLPDSVIVRGTVSDDHEIASVRISLIDQDLFPTSVQRTVTIGATSGQFNAQLLMSDVEIASGPHYIQVVADDGENTTREFIEVDVSEVPRVYLGMVVAVGAGAGSDYILLRTDGTQMILHQSDDRHLMMDIDPIAGRIYHITNEEAALQRIDVSETENTSLTTPFDATSGEFYSDLVYDRIHKEVVVSSPSGLMIRYNRNGGQLGQLDLGMFTAPFQLSSEGDLILAETRNPNGTDKRLRTYDRFSFSELDEDLLPMDLFDILDLGGDRRLLIGQQGDLRKILVYDISESDYEERSIIGPTPPLDVCAQGENALLAYDDVFYRFITSSQELIPFSVPTTQAVAYDEVNGIAYLASGGTVTAYGLPLFNALDSWTFSGEVQDMQPLYNK